MSSSSLQTLLNRIPSFYKKIIGTITSSIDIKIPAPPSTGIVTIGTALITAGSSKIVQLMSSVAFSLDFLLANIQTLKDISYVGQIPVEIQGQDQYLRFFSTFGTVNASLSITQDVSGNYFLTSDAGYAMKISPAGVGLITYGSFGTGPGQLIGPSSIIRETVNDTVWVADSNLGQIPVYDPSGPYAGNGGFTVGSPGIGNGQFQNISSMAFDSNNSLIYVLDGTNRIQKFDVNGIFQSVFMNIAMIKPQNLYFDTNINLFVSDLTGKIHVFKEDGTYVTTFSGPSGSSYIGITVVNDPGGVGNYILASDETSMSVHMFSYTPGIPPSNFSFYDTFSGEGTGLGQTGHIVAMMVNSAQEIVTVDETFEKVSFFNLTTIDNNKFLFPGFFEYSTFPGNVFNINQTTFNNYHYNVPILQNGNVTTYTIIKNTGDFSFRCNDVIISPNNYQVYNWRKEISAWMPVQVTGFNSNALATVNPTNAVIVPGPIFPGHISPDLDPLGKNYGVTRIVYEDDITYKKRISESVTGKKLVPSGFIDQFRIIYGQTAQVYQWFPSSYSQLVTYLNANPGFTGFYLDGNQVSPGASPLDLTASQGPYNTFYVVISGVGNLNFQN